VEIAPEIKRRMTEIKEGIAPDIYKWILSLIRFLDFRFPIADLSGNSDILKI